MSLPLSPSQSNGLETPDLRSRIWRGRATRWVQGIGFFALLFVILNAPLTGQESAGGESDDASIIQNVYENTESEEKAPAEHIYMPKGAGEGGNDDRIYGLEAPDSSSVLTRAGFWIILLGLVAAGIVWLNKKGFFQNRSLSGSERKLVIEETTSLGGRQFLVVARHGKSTMLLGVGQGFVTHLKDLETGEVHTPREFKLNPDE